ncbi:hypothetical protein D3Z55_09280 [Clostridiaceae bacterium]|nr:hypothetical protein [Clostridiaceae bacterium]
MDNHLNILGFIGEKCEKIENSVPKAHIALLMVCHGSILKNPGKACKINDSTIWQGVYCTTTTPFLKEP